jgi:hypothetical protein
MSTYTDTTQDIQAAARKFAEAVAHTKIYKEFEQYMIEGHGFDFAEMT